MRRFVHLDWIGPIALLTLNRAERHNSLVPGLLEDLIAALEEVKAEPDVRAMVLMAKGRSFSTGGDIREFYKNINTIEEYAGIVVGKLNQVILALIDLPVPIVAAVHGIITGGSLGFVLASDIVLMAPEASIIPYYNVLGFSPDGGWTALLPNIIGPKRTAEILMLNQTITAEQAVAWGLANRVISSERIHEEALNTAQQIADQSPGTIHYTKRLVSVDKTEIAVRLEAERSNFVKQITTEEAQRGMQAFLENPQKNT